MRVRIHRGAHEIGGSCVEVESGHDRIVLDVGRPLSVARGESVDLPSLTGLTERDDSLLGVVISHAHQDHWGLVDQVAPGVPLYMGAATHRILVEAAFWTNGFTAVPTGFLVHRETFRLGPFSITPFLNDHSAFDAYSLLVEAEGRSLFYTGDIRGHGRKSDIFEELLRKPPRPVHVLLMEGTNVPGERAVERPAESEDVIEARCAELLSATGGIGLMFFSPQNIDRLVTLYRATLRSGRDFVMDLYTAGIAAATGNANIPQPGWERVRVFVPRWQQRKVKQARAFSRVEDVKPWRLFEEDLVAAPQRYAMRADVSVVRRLAELDGLANAHAWWSMWAGYLSEESGQDLQATLAASNVPLKLEHTSGHASIADLRRLARALRPEGIVPIHSFGGHRFDEYFQQVTARPDGEWWSV